MITRFKHQLNNQPGELNSLLALRPNPSSQFSYLSETEQWQSLLANGINNLHELARYLQLEEHTLLPQKLCQKEMESDFPTRIPLPYASRITKGNINDPLLRQVLPTLFEQEVHAGFTTDPLTESRFNPVNGLLHKYGNRALMVTSGACPIHCRYCFRRHFDYAENNPGREKWSDTFQYLKNDDKINEIIFSGGDPLTAKDAHLAWLTHQIEQIPTIKRLRIHTRFPVVIPQRVTTGLTDWLSSLRLQKVIVLHINHAAEIDDEVSLALARLKHTGATLLNQSVILKGVNDSADILGALSEKLFAVGVLPYYLHMPDKVANTAHFDVSEATAIGIYQQLQARLPGFLVPKLVREIPKSASKTLIATQSV